MTTDSLLSKLPIKNDDIEQQAICQILESADSYVDMNIDSKTGGITVIFNGHSGSIRDYLKKGGAVGDLELILDCNDDEARSAARYVVQFDKSQYKTIKFQLDEYLSFMSWLKNARAPDLIPDMPPDSPPPESPRFSIT